MTIKDEIKHLHNLLQHQGRWYIDISCPDIDMFYDIAEQAKEHADYTLSKISVNALYARFKRWEKSDRIIPPDADYYFSFLSDMAWDIGLSALKGRDRDLYQESVSLTIKFN